MNSEYNTYGIDILTTAIFAILLTEPTLSLVLNNIGHHLLEKDH